MTAVAFVWNPQNAKSKFHLQYNCLINQVNFYTLKFHLCWYTRSSILPHGWNCNVWKFTLFFRACFFKVISIKLEFILFHGWIYSVWKITFIKTMLMLCFVAARNEFAVVELDLSSPKTNVTHQGLFSKMVPRLDLIINMHWNYICQETTSALFNHLQTNFKVGGPTVIFNCLSTTVIQKTQIQWI